MYVGESWTEETMQCGKCGDHARKEVECCG